MKEEKNESLEKVGSFVSSTFNKIVNLIIFLIIVGLIVIIGWFWHNSQLDKQRMELLEKQNMEMKEELKKDEARDLEVKKESVEVEEVENEPVVVSNSNVVKTKDIINENSTIDGKNQVYFEIKELGVKFLVDDDLANRLTYKLVSKNIINISTKELNSVENSFCDSQLLHIFRGEGVYKQEVGGINYSKSVKQFKNFYIIPTGPQASCTNGQNTSLEHSILDELMKQLNVSLTEI